MKYNFTIFLTFFADGDIRRKYIEIALNTLFDNNSKDVPIIVIDASSEIYSKKNKSLFLEFSNLTYINDQEINPFKRCDKFMHLIATPFVLRLLEDCAYIGLGKENFVSIQNDILLMERNKEINVVHYPIIDDQEFTVKGNTVFYSPINFKNKVLLDSQGYKYYDRFQEDIRYHYLCNNVLYRTDFFLRHWKYIGTKYTNHNSAESTKPNNKLFKFLFGRRYFYSIGGMLYKFYEKLFHSNEIISSIYITETMLNSDIIHIGYYSTEVDLDIKIEALGRKPLILNDNIGVSSTLDDLKIFRDFELLNKIRFERDIQY